MESGVAGRRGPEQARQSAGNENSSESRLTVDVCQAARLPGCQAEVGAELEGIHGTG